ncbi:MAG: hypothetical protein AVDCRST_MAG30-2019 [uncultured Solirubrobacteraceae bacterium]|uniref:Histidine-specific methyltransferase SAM-dependent domain-containing protein n=1 Tax=uncultured Solirubrobacteraceae bacterium TaxID=1162706 RepID=A0A6J4SQV5_9ACTN|nr:MAG: hypothetical protein AVDCRST_MAG30-2019 [uncultured Solirubrobacteraceae bacterium]
MSGVEVHDLAPETSFDADGADLAEGLRAEPKVIPSVYAYDADGSRFYEEITELPTYYLTRAEWSLLERHARDIAAASRCEDIVEMGSGSAKKTRVLLEALRDRPDHGLRYVPIDISLEMLEESTRALAEALPGLAAQAVAADYENGLAWVRDALDAPRMIVFLGSSLGNFGAEGIDALLGSIAASCEPGDELLLGVDLIKDGDVLERCYNDPPGFDAFARFRVNRLNNVNRLFGGDFDPAHFTSHARWRPELSHVEAHIHATREMRVHLRDLGLEVALAEGEPVLVDVAHKFDRADLAGRLDRLGFDEAGDWIDGGHGYALLLYRRR